MQPPAVEQDFSIDIETLIAGRFFLPNLSKEEIISILKKATEGKVATGSLVSALAGDKPIEFHAEPHNRDTWLANLHLQVIGSPRQIDQSTYLKVVKTDHLLRSNDIPFDGIDDLCGFLGLSDTRSNGRACGITIRVLPPVDFSIDSGRLVANRLTLRFDAHPNFSTQRISCAIREFPGRGVATRRQIGEEIDWHEPTNQIRQGFLEIDLENSDSVLIALSADGMTIRRHWFVDQEKSINAKYVATQLFDRELKQLRQAVLPDVSDPNKNDSARFEKGITSLIFLLGFCAGSQVETDAPDIIFSTPSGRLGLVECTLKPAEFRTKLDKLVSRRNELVSKLTSNGHTVSVTGFLVCGCPRSDLNVDEKHLAKSKIILLSREDIEKSLFRIRNPIAPDELLQLAIDQLDRPTLDSF